MGQDLKLALRVFCAKEAVYKAWYPRGQKVLEFSEVEVELRAVGDATVARVLAAPRSTLAVRWVQDVGHQFAAAVMNAGDET